MQTGEIDSTSKGLQISPHIREATVNLPTLHLRASVKETCSSRSLTCFAWMFVVYQTSVYFVYGGKLYNQSPYAHLASVNSCTTFCSPFITLLLLIELHLLLLQMFGCSYLLAMMASGHSSLSWFLAYLLNLNKIPLYSYMLCSWCSLGYLLLCWASIQHYHSFSVCSQVSHIPGFIVIVTCFCIFLLMSMLDERSLLILLRKRVGGCWGGGASFFGWVFQATWPCLFFWEGFLFVFIFPCKQAPCLPACSVLICKPS